jgi:hypothetical protein
VHQQRFGVPGKSLLGGDSHTPAAGAIGMLAIGAGGLEIAMALAGEPFRIVMPRVWGVELIGLRDGPGELELRIGNDETIRARHDLSSRQVDLLLTRGSIPWKRHRREQRKRHDADRS